MEKIISCFTTVTKAGLLWLLVGCEPHEPTANSPASVSTDLVGRWHYDSAGAAFYDSQGRYLSRFMNPLPPGAWLTIGSQRWTYSGSVREEHTYSRSGNTLWVRRVVDTALVRGGHARPEDLGNADGVPNTKLITILTRHRLVLCDSTTDPDGSLTRVWRFYFSR
ncbi:hypothetical protein SAMN02745146_3358 [Hymenobacter daecheongensis DSM 21074]|uniref:Lipocalin-like domain-containing protein n=1 Tax=Hymenobacter daecheongensis DSM 21074 TaxID=1121955 RepID=A0A1M6K1L1_9BACT|nr:hypothetical protein [Hymenobacter daecheongensis]SHJ52817.1 hypothetical protein SAMN02745146_3358 [Hymenobacter daecheongensis DSM 21074]